MSWIFLTTSILTWCAYQTQGYNILSFMPLAVPSHVKPFQPLLYELSKRGHNVTEISTYPPTKNMENYNHIYIPSLFAPHNIMMFRNRTHRDLIRLYHELCLLEVEKILKYPDIQTFIQRDQSNFDAIILEGTFCGESFYALGHKYNAHVINFYPLGYSSSNHYTLGNLLSPAFAPDFRLPATSRMDLWDRISSVWFTLNDMYYHFYEYYPHHRQLMKKYMKYEGFESRPDLIDMVQNTSITFIEYDSVIGITLPLPPNIVFTGGMHLGPSKSLPQDLEKFMSEAIEGVIYMSFGTNLKLSDLPPNIFDDYLNVFKKIKQRILWKIDIEVGDMPENVITRKWFPQSDILGHKNCKLFITHGGIHSAMESVYNGVPMVMMPGFSDQFQNVLLLQEKGLGRLINMNSLNSDVISEAVQEVLTNSMYTENAKRISSILRSSSMSPLERGVYWTEYVLKHNGAHFLKPSSIKLSLVQFLCLDIFLFISAVLFVFLYVVVKIIKLVTRSKEKHKTE